MDLDQLCQSAPNAKTRLVLLHGWGADASDLFPLGRVLCEEIDRPVELIALHAPQLQTQGTGRQWYGLFPPDWSAVPAAIADLKQRIIAVASREIPLEATAILGFSQGGAMALGAGCELPLAGIVACSGYPHPRWEAPVNRPPVLLLHGKRDEVVPHSAALALREQLSKGTQPCKLFSFEEGHTISNEAQAEIRTILKVWLAQPEHKP